MSQGLIYECNFCNDDTQMKTITCFRCESKTDVKKNYFERIESCPDPTHNHVSLSVWGIQPDICKSCQDDGYYVETEGPLLGFSAEYIVKRKTSDNPIIENCVCDEDSLKSLQCFRCYSEWEVVKNKDERIRVCTIHNVKIQRCESALPPICSQCEDLGYYIESDVPMPGFCQGYSIKNRKSDILS